MGANGSYSKEFNAVPEVRRTHVSLDTKIEGHKILVQKSNPYQKKIPMNSNSENPWYLVAKVDKETEDVKISSIAIYDKHAIVKVIDLEFDSSGNVIPYSSDVKSSHSHNWVEDIGGNFGRKSHDTSNRLPVDVDNSLIQKIVEFNKKKEKWLK